MPTGAAGSDWKKTDVYKRFTSSLPVFGRFDLYSAAQRLGEQTYGR